MSNCIVIHNPISFSVTLDYILCVPYLQRIFIDMNYF
nr:MAG TPA: hypothetical protein [Caudoviricetes sp.]